MKYIPTYIAIVGALINVPLFPYLANVVSFVGCLGIAGGCYYLNKRT